MHVHRAPVTAVILGLVSIALRATPIPSSFTTCISGSGTGSVCQLSPGTYQVTSTLVIGRSNFTIQGGTSVPTDTVLQRNFAVSTQPGNYGQAIMYMNDGLTNVTIQYLTFDGNRYSQTVNPPGNGVYCTTTSPILEDLNLSHAGEVTVQYVDFVNAPGHTLLLGGTQSVIINGKTVVSTVSYSNFGMGLGSEPASQTAGRWHAIILCDNGNVCPSGQVTGIGAYYNNIAYAGYAAIVMWGTYQMAYGNTLSQNRLEMPDGITGGQVYIAGQLSLQQGSAHNTAAANIINGNYWQTTWDSSQGASKCAQVSGQTYSGSNPSGSTEPCKVNWCPVTPSMPGNAEQTGGIEAYGTGHRFYNNSVIQHMAAGIGISGGASMTVSGSNPWNPNDSAKYIEHNNWAGVHFLGPSFGFAAGTGMTLDDVRSVCNNDYGVHLDQTTGPGFINGSCIFGNQLGNISPVPNNLTNQTPGSYSTPPCPTTCP